MIGLVAEGRSRTEMARALGISEWTVKHHLTAIRLKLGAACMAEAVARAYQRRILEVPPLPGTLPDDNLDPEDASTYDAAAPQS